MNYKEMMNEILNEKHDIENDLKYYEFEIFDPKNFRYLKKYLTDTNIDHINVWSILGTHFHLLLYYSKNDKNWYLIFADFTRDKEYSRFVTKNVNDIVRMFNKYKIKNYKFENKND